MDAAGPFNTIVSSFLLVAASEMGDKTQLLAFSLISRFRKPWSIMAGILAATILNHGLASYFGCFISSYVSPKYLALILALTFIAFGIWTLRPDKLNSDETRSNFDAFAATLVLFFLAEMGDKTQLATVALAAKYQSPLQVTIGTTAGMLASDGLAVFLGERLAARVKVKWIRWIAASLFFVFGIISLLTAFTIC